MSVAEIAGGLVARAQAGDRAAFDRLAAECLPQVRGVVRRMIGHPDDSDDVVQEALTKAWQSIGSFRGEAKFSTWLTSIAARLAVDLLRKQKRWRAEAQIAYANLCFTDEVAQRELIGAASAPDFAFEVRQHIAYCFACVGRSLPPDEQAALVLSDVVDMSDREAAKVLGVSEPVFRHRLAAARAAMRDRYEGLCALVSKTGICHQCKGLRQVAPEAKRGGPFPDVADLADRIAVVRSAEFGTGSMGRFHDVFWRRTKEIEQAGTGTTIPLGDCGRD
jgi:RNA polymerase sigma-70 factor (ECF subfamily)